MDRMELNRQIRMTPNGRARMDLLRKGWEMADQEQDYDAQISYRLDYMHQSVFYDDLLEIYIVYPEVLKLHDRHMKEFGYDRNTRSIMWKYKWLLENAADFYQISQKQYELFSQDMKRRFQQNNYSLRSLYEYQFVFWQGADAEKAAEGYRLFSDSRRDTLSDCQACERAREVDYFLQKNAPEEALERAQPLLDGRMRCSEEPECTSGFLLRYFAQEIARGDMTHQELAEELCEKVKRGISRRGIATTHIPSVLLYYALTQPAKALNYFKKYWHFYETNRNPNTRYWFALAAVCFLKQLGGRKTYRMSLDPAFPLYNEKNVYEVSALRAYYEKAGLEIAAKMDQRNGNSLYADRWKDMTGRE